MKKLLLTFILALILIPSLFASFMVLHYPLRRVDTGTSHIGPLVYVDNPADWATVHPHAQTKIGMRFQRAADF